MTASPTLTRDLLARYLAGNLDSERRLFDRFRAELLARARRHRLMRAASAHTTPDDVVQEVFWRALSTDLLRKFEDRGPDSLAGALSVVLERTLIDLCRRQTALKRGANAEAAAYDENSEPVAGVVGPLMSTDTTPTTTVRRDDLIEHCRRHLDERDWDVWSALELQGLDAAEVADRLGISASAVRGILFRARAKLIRVLASEDDSGD